MAKLKDIKLAPAILQAMVSQFIAAQDQISDLNESSTTYEIFYCVARAIEDIYLKLHIGVGDISAEMAKSLFDFSQKKGAFAAGEITFTLKEAETKDQVIPSGTIVKSALGKEYKTSESLTIRAGKTTGTVAARAVEIGKESNTAGGKIEQKPDGMDFIKSVSNKLPFTGGADGESDTSFLLRFADYIRGLGGSNDHYYTQKIEALDGVADCKAFTYAPPKDISGQLYNLILYIDDGAGSASKELIAKAKQVLFGTGSSGSTGSASGDGGILTGGIACYIAAAQKMSVDIAATIHTDGIVPLETTKTQVETAITNYINNLKIGERVIRSSLIEIMHNTDHVVNVELEAPAANQDPKEYQAAKLNSLKLKMEIDKWT